MLSSTSSESAASMRRAMNDAIAARDTSSEGPYWVAGRPLGPPSVMPSAATHSISRSKVLQAMSVKGSGSVGTPSQKVSSSCTGGGVYSTAAAALTAARKGTTTTVAKRANRIGIMNGSYQHWWIDLGSGT